ncbi:Nif3-like dinuclear metal center hexameric protein [Candidatus Woesearchaeota archaeon]|nr:Nif3-like dinuclear metal center hexameric protein [Candidatus Woesearchaeota archaeon]
MAPTLLSITRCLNKLLDVKNVPDTSKNGMQVKAGKEVKKIGFAVDACMEVFAKAKKQKCDLVIVHHGILWKHQKYKKHLEKRINFLKKNKISLYAAHLPLDKHDKYGNAIVIANILRLKNTNGFGVYEGIPVGFRGELKKKLSVDELSKNVNKLLKTKSKVFNFNKKKIKTVGIVTGGGSSTLQEAIEKKLDCFITGEVVHMIYNYAKESKINMISAGHYATETFGVKALMPILKEKFGVDVVFIDAPTGL